MTRFRRPKTTIGRTPYQLRMPFPGDFSPQNVLANFRELARWANELPYDGGDNFVPYFFQYAPEDPQEVWDVDLVALLQSKFTTDLMPTGTWLVFASLLPTGAPDGAVGIDASLLVSGPNIGIPGRVYESIGYMDSGAIRIVDSFDIDFTAETFEPTYKWYLPELGGLGTAKPTSLNLLAINAADDTLSIEGEARYAYIVDDTVDGTLAQEPMPSFLYAWAYRLSDGYNIPTSLEDVTP